MTQQNTWDIIQPRFYFVANSSQVDVARSYDSAGVINNEYWELYLNRSIKWRVPIDYVSVQVNFMHVVMDCSNKLQFCHHSILLHI